MTEKNFQGVIDVFSIMVNMVSLVYTYMKNDQTIHSKHV